MRAAKFVLPLLFATPADAGGLTLPIHGVRSLQRGGALIAGADDADALWLNPGGLGHLAGDKKQALLFDVSLVYQAVAYTRLDASGTLFPRQTNQQPGTLVPTIVGALGIGDRLVIAGGVAFPDQTFHRYAADGPQRYASVSLDGSRNAIVTAGVGYKVSDQLRVGATLSTFVTSTKLAVVASGCPQTMTCAPEDPSFDMGLALDQTDALSITGSIGVSTTCSRTRRSGSRSMARAGSPAPARSPSISRARCCSTTPRSLATKRRSR